jgi:hypothetical protein
VVEPAGTSVAASAGMKLVGLSMLLAACVESGSPQPPPAPPPPAPIDVDDCWAPDCPYVGALTAPIRDDDIAETMLAVAVNGIDAFGYETIGAAWSTTEATGAWTKLSDDGSYVRVRATMPGTGHFEAIGHVPYHDTEVFGHDQFDLDVLPAAQVRLDLPRYVALDPAQPIAPVVVGTDFTMAVRVLSADGRRLVDTTLVTTGPTTEQVGWNLFGTDALSIGHHEVTVTADSLAQPATLGFDTVARIDEIRTTDVREPYPSYYHLVCAHAFANSREVYSEWKMTAANATGWIPADAGNCLEVVPGDTVATVTFTGADNTSATLLVPE